MNADLRKQQMLTWLQETLSLDILSCEPASADASFRRYFRIELKRDVAQPDWAVADAEKTRASDSVETPASKTFVIMDSPPDKEPLDAFLAITSLLRGQTLRAPKIFQKNLEQGYLVLEDFGSTTFLDRLADQPDLLYDRAIDDLVKLQIARYSTPDAELAAYSKSKLIEEMQLFEQWYLNIHLGETLNSAQATVWRDLKDFLVAQCLEQPQVWVHRDFHSRNLMVLHGGEPGIIDYQDMVMGPIAYDPASLFKDCYIAWPRARQLGWLQEYFEKLQEAKTLLNSDEPIFDFDYEQLVYWYDMTALQRHIKVLGIFCRLNYRDNKPNYINDLPMVKSYVNEVVCLYSELADFKQHFSEVIA